MPVDRDRLILIEAIQRIDRVLDMFQSGTLYPSKHAIPCLRQLLLMVDHVAPTGAMDNPVALAITAHYTLGVIVGVEAALGVPWTAAQATEQKGEKTPVLGLDIPRTKENMN